MQPQVMPPAISTLLEKKCQNEISSSQESVTDVQNTSGKIS